MSDSPPQSSLGWLRVFFRSRWFLGGFCAGLVLMGWLGRRATATDFHPQFTRFFPTISPEANYYPTIDEMCAIVRARCRPDQILVIVGGNSILQGVWQPADVMWTRRLQEQLGDGYCVINFALRGATPADGGAVVAEVLRTEFPRQIYIANEKAMTGIFPLGNEVYRPIFWQAYFDGRLLSYAPRDFRVKEYLVHRNHRADVPGIVGGALLDRVLRFDDFWNRMAFERFNTVSSIFAPAPPAMFSPRKFFRDDEPDGTDIPLERRYQPAVRETEMIITRGTTVLCYDRTPDGWALKPDTQRDLRHRFGEAFPDRLRPRTLLLVGRDSPYYRLALSPEDLARDEQGIRDTVALMREFDYAVLDYGADFTDLDYADRTHLSPPGGEKLARKVAAEVIALTEKLGYRR
jgi:hypothetical protein